MYGMVSIPSSRGDVSDSMRVRTRVGRPCRLNPLKSGRCFRLRSDGCFHLGVRVSIPSSRGDVSDRDSSPIAASSSRSLNPLKSGRCFRRKLVRKSWPYSSGLNPLKSGRCFRLLRTVVGIVAILHRSQSPQVGAMFQTLEMSTMYFLS